MRMSPGATGMIKAGLKGIGIPSCLRSRSFSVQVRGPAPVLRQVVEWHTRESQKLVICGFESRLADQFKIRFRTVAQLVDAPDLNPVSAARRCRFDPGLSDHVIPIPPRVGVQSGFLVRFLGVSNTSGGTTIRDVAQLAERRSHKPDVVRSIRTFSTKSLMRWQSPVYCGGLQIRLSSVQIRLAYP